MGASINVGIKQVKRIIAKVLGYPYFTGDLGVLDRYGKPDPGIFQEVVFLLNERIIGLAFVIDALLGIALLPSDSDTHQWHTKVLGPLDEVASKNAKATCIYLEVIMQSVFHAEISHRRKVLMVHENTSLGFEQ